MRRLGKIETIDASHALFPLPQAQGEGAACTLARSPFRFPKAPPWKSVVWNLSVASILAPFALLCGCNFAPKYTRPVLEAPAAFKELTTNQFPQTNAWKMAEPNDGFTRGHWWELFGDTNLNALEVRAGASNQTVAIAFANFGAARAVVKQTRSGFFPTVSANPSVTRMRQPASGNPTRSNSSAVTFTEYSLPLDASWELDFWGRVRNSVSASQREAEAVLADLESVRLTIHAELASDYFQLRALDAQRQLLEAAVVAYAESVRLTQVRHDTGISSDQDVAQAETQLAVTRAQATDLAILRAQFEHAIAVLVGEAASTFSIPAETPTNRVVVLPFGVPSQLLERRPDIAAAERRVAEANAQIGVARAAYFPAVTLNGSVGYQSSSLNNLVSWPTFAWSVGATLAQTVFDAGRRRAVTEQASAQYQATVANYRQTVLTGFQEVEDSLSALRLLSQELDEQEAAVNSAQRYLTLANDRYRLGIDGYLNVIVAQTSFLNNQRTVVTLRSQQMTAAVQLIKALGGGWEAAPSSSPRELSSGAPAAAVRD